MKLLFFYVHSLIGAGVMAFPTIKSGCRKAPFTIRIHVRQDNVVDLTHKFDENSAYWPNNPSGFELKTLFSGFTKDPLGFFYSTKSFSQPEHLGTHMDSPSHFAVNGNMASEVALSSLIGPGVLINLKHNGERFGPDSQISIEDILRWEQNRGSRMRSGSIVLLYTGYGDIYDDRAAFFGTNMTGNESVPYLRFPGLSPTAAQWLITKRCVAAIGIDTASIDFGRSTDFQTHRILHENNVPNFENVANLDQLVENGKDFNVIALPQKISKGTGAPVRIVAVLGL